MKLEEFEIIKNKIINLRSLERKVDDLKDAKNNLNDANIVDTVLSSTLKDTSTKYNTVHVSKENLIKCMDDSLSKYTKLLRKAKAEFNKIQIQNLVE